MAEDRKMSSTSNRTVWSLVADNSMWLFDDEEGDSSVIA